MSKFKVGDKVRVTDLLIMDDKVGLCVGDVGVVTSWKKSGADGWAQFRDEVYEGKPWFVQARQLELVTDELPARFKFQHHPSMKFYDAEVREDGVYVTWGAGDTTYSIGTAKYAVEERMWVITEVISEPTTAESLQAATDALADAVRAAKDADAVEIELYESYHAAKDRACNLRAARNAAENAHREALAKHYGIS